MRLQAVVDFECIDEEMSDVQLFYELSRALAMDESRFAEKVMRYIHQKLLRSQSQYLNLHEQRRMVRGQ